MNKPALPNLRDVYHDLDDDILSKLTNHAYWITDYYTKSIDRIQSRSTNLLGLIGVELGFLAPWTASDFSNSYLNSDVTKMLVILGILSIVSGLFWLLLCLKDKPIRHPSYDEINWIINSCFPDERRFGPLHTLLTPEEDTNENLFDNLRRVKSEINKSFKLAILSVGFFQFFILLLIFLKWI